MKLKTAAALLLLPLPLACTDDLGSSAVRTSGLYPVYEAVAEGNGKTQVSAQLRVETADGAYVFLEPPDALTASSPDKTVPLGGDSGADHPTYTGTLPGDEEGLELQIRFERTNQEEDAPESVVTLPAPFELGVIGTGSVERGGSVTLQWKKGSGTMVWTASGPCMNPSTGATADDGELTLDAGDVEAWSSDAKTSCDVTVTLERSAQGTVDPAFEPGGQFLALQRRTVSINPPPKN